MRSRDRRPGLTCTAITAAAIAFGACGAHPDEVDPMAEVEAKREQTRIRVFGSGSGPVEEAKQAQFDIPCLPPFCTGDIGTVSVMACGAFTYTKCGAHSWDGSLVCSTYAYNNLERPVGGVVRYYFINAPTQFEGTANVCFEIDTYTGNGKKGKPHLNVAGPNGWLYFLDNVQTVYMRTGYHVYGGVFGNENYNVYSAAGSSGQGANEQWPHSLPPQPGWISSVAGFYNYQGQWPEYQGYGP